MADNRGTFQDGIAVIPDGQATPKAEIDNYGNAQFAGSVVVTGTTALANLIATGTLQFGTVTTSSGGTIAGYITITDANGTARKIPVIS